MDPNEAMQQARDTLTVKRVFGTRTNATASP